MGRNHMTSSTRLNTSLVSLARALKTAFKLDQRCRHRMQAGGSLHLLFQSSEGPIASESVTLHDTFLGGLAFRSSRLFCVRNYVCLSDGIEAMEVIIEHRREDGEEGVEFVYVVTLEDLEPLPERWRQRLGIAGNRLEAIVARCHVHGEKAFDAS